ncbi:Uncharacterized membrane protein YccC [Rhizobiales bacterium GAS191]|nr:Uncharacterized membrane protein YccC [Rhizobiales bacterium GAS191]
MKAAVDRAPSRDRLLKGPGWLDHHTAVGLTFAVKTFAASLLALYIAFWAGLDDPRWAFLTVFVVSQPDSGLVLAKGFYRILGSIAGVIVTAALVFGLAQYGELFVTAVALWICFCNFAARAVRNFASYGFQLAGYTVAIVGIPAALEPAGAYPLVLARLTEILLGIIRAALVSRLILVRELSPQFIEFVRALGRRADSYAAAVLAPDTDRERVATERAEFAKAYLDVQAMQHSTYFESAEARILDQPLRRLTRAAVELCTMAEAAASHRGGSHPHPEEITSLGVGISATNESQTEDDPMVSAMVCAADERDLRLARARLRMRMEAFERGEELPEPNVAYRLWSDPVPAVLIGIRSALAVAITSTLWFATAWPNGPAAVVVAAVVCSLLASMEQPDKISLAAAATVLIAAIPVFATQFYLMPLAVDFASMAVALAPLMLTCGFIMAQPRIGPLGLLSAVYFAFASNIGNVMTYDAVAFLNSSLAILVGIAVAVVLFATFFPESPAFAVRRFRRQLVVRLGYLARSSGRAYALSGYQLGLSEQLGATLSHVKDEPEAAHECFASARAALSVAIAIGRLGGSLDARVMAPGIAASGARLLGGLSQNLRNPSVRKFRRLAGEALALSRNALATARGSVEPEQIEALSGVVVGSATLGLELTRAPMVLQGKSNAIRI